MGCQPARPFRSTPTRDEPVQYPTLDQTFEFDPSSDADPDSVRLSIPAKSACYLLEDSDRSPVLLATTANFRQAVTKRLLAPPEVPVAGKVDYRQFVRRIRYRIVGSQFEGNWTYLHNVHETFPKQFRQLTKHWTAHWIQLDRSVSHPRLSVTQSPVDPATDYAGPFAAQKAARNCVELVEDLFDLCRYYDVLAQSPNGQPCAYKEMAKCQAPCDGSMPMADYQRDVRAAFSFLTGDRDTWIESTQAAMRSAASDLAFEVAARLKAKVDRIDELNHESCRFLNHLDGFRFVTIQPGTTRKRCSLFVVDRGRIAFIDEFPRDITADDLASPTASCHRHFADPTSIVDRTAATAMAMVSWHLFQGSRDRGWWLRYSDSMTPEDVRYAIDRMERNKSDSHAAIEHEASEPKVN